MSSAKHTHHHAHHYRDAHHEFESSILGVWLFLVTEILMFGGLFVGYIIYSAKYPAMFLEGATHLDWRLGAVNTVILLFSSLTMALSIYYIQKNQTRKSFWAIVLTLLCGCGFMIVKYFEYTHKIHMGLLPGNLFSYTEAESGNLALYFSFYFSMTGLHASHVLIGMLLMVWLLFRMKKGHFSSQHYTAIEGTGLFWHLVDLIWIYLFPLLYLI